MSDSGSRENSDASSAPNPKAIYKEGFGLFARGDVDGAIRRYREALDLDPTLAIAWNGLSMALAKRGELDEAIEAAEKLVELEPDEPLSHTNLSRILMQKGLIPEAEDARARATGLQMRRR